MRLQPLWRNFGPKINKLDKWRKITASTPFKTIQCQRSSALLSDVNDLSSSAMPMGEWGGWFWAKINDALVPPKLFGVNSWIAQMIRQWIPDCWSGDRKCTDPKCAAPISPSQALPRLIALDIGTLLCLETRAERFKCQISYFRRSVKIRGYGRNSRVNI